MATACRRQRRRDEEEKRRPPHNVTRGRVYSAGIDGR
jgi:hypothetical protein